MRWRLELISSLDFDIKYRPGVDNEAAYCFSRVHCAALSQHDPLYYIHDSLCHPGETRMIHYVRSNNLPYSIAEVKGVCSRCSICAKLKPRFYKPSNPPLIHATQPMERLSMDSKGPLPSSTTMSIYQFRGLNFNACFVSQFCMFRFKCMRLAEFFYIRKYILLVAD